MSTKEKRLHPQGRNADKEATMKIEKKYADKAYCWHVIVGRNFGGCLTYKEKVMTYFYVGQIGFLIFATSEV